MARDASIAKCFICKRPIKDDEDFCVIDNAMGDSVEIHMHHWGVEKELYRQVQKPLKDNGKKE